MQGKASAVDVEQAIERVIVSRSEKFFPTPAVVLDRVSSVVKSRREEDATRSRREEQERDPLTPEQIDSELAEVRELRKKVFPHKHPEKSKKAPTKKVPLSTKPKELPPLTADDQVLIDRLNKEWSEDHDIRPSGNSDGRDADST